VKIGKQRAQAVIRVSGGHRRYLAGSCFRKEPGSSHWEIVSVN